MKTDRLTPKARKDELIVKELANELLVYDEKNQKAHCLNQTAALVWKSCDGRSDIPRITRRLAKSLGIPVLQESVQLAIRQLAESHLLEIPKSELALLPRTSRREVVRRLGIAAISVPIVTSLLAPAAVQAASCVPLGGSCTSTSQCCPGPSIACAGPGPLTCRTT